MNEKDLENLVFGMAHQVRNPAAIIKSNAGVVLKKESLSPEGRRSVESILNGVKYLEERLDEFVEFSKPLRLAARETSLRMLVSDACSLLKEACRLKRIRVAADLEDVQASLDRDQMIVAVLNVLLNAVEAIPEEGGSISITLKRADRKAALMVKDEGAGIPPRDLPKIFSPFYTTKPNSIGIGLPVAKRIVEAHGGKISVESEPKKGTTVSISIPCS